MNRKAMGDNMLYSILNFVLYIIVLVSVFLLINQYIVKSIPVNDVRSDIFLQRLLATPEGISYRDPLTQRVEPGLIDHARFNQSYLNATVFNSSLFYGENNRILAARLRLMLSSGNVKEAVYNQEYFDMSYFWARSNLQGTNVELRIKQLPVTLRSEPMGRVTYLPATLTVEMVMPRD